MPSDSLPPPNSEPLLADLPPALGRYGVIRRIGRGGFAEVYLGRDPEAGSFVALKVLREDIDPQVRDQVRTRFLAEEAIARAVDHPAVVRIRETSPRGQCPCFIAMDYVDGLPFCEYFERQRAREARDSKRLGRLAHFTEVARLGHQVAQAMCVAHSRGIVHRDLKPDNVLIVSEGITARVRILDFGIAKAPPHLFSHDRAPAVTRYYTELGTVMGSPPYMAPEQNGGAHAVSGKADVFALGVMLLVALLGLDARALEAGEQHLVLPAEFDTLVRGTALPDRLRQLLRSMVDEDAERRPSMHDVALGLQRAARREDRFAAAVERWVRDGEIPRSGKLVEILSLGEQEVNLTEDEAAFLQQAPRKKLQQVRLLARAALLLLVTSISGFAAAWAYGPELVGSSRAARMVQPLKPTTSPAPSDTEAPERPPTGLVAASVVRDQNVRLEEEKLRSAEQSKRLETLGAAASEHKRARAQAERQLAQIQSRVEAGERSLRECRAESERHGQALAECRRDVEVGLGQLVESAERLRLCARSLREQSEASRPPADDTMMD